MFVARRSFLHNGQQYQPNDVVKGFPENFGLRPEAFIRSGMIQEQPDPPKAVIKKTKPVMEEVKAE